MCVTPRYTTQADAQDVSGTMSGRERGREGGDAGQEGEGSDGEGKYHEDGGSGGEDMGLEDECPAQWSPEEGEVETCPPVGYTAVDLEGGQRFHVPLSSDLGKGIIPGFSDERIKLWLRTSRSYRTVSETAASESGIGVYGTPTPLSTVRMFFAMGMAAGCAGLLDIGAGVARILVAASVLFPGTPCVGVEASGNLVALWNGYKASKAAHTVPGLLQLISDVAFHKGMFAELDSREFAGCSHWVAVWHGWTLADQSSAGAVWAATRAARRICIVDRGVWFDTMKYMKKRGFGPVKEVCHPFTVILQGGSAFTAHVFEKL
jgi:hypothetical protein